MAEKQGVDFRFTATDAASAAFKSVQRSIDATKESYGQLTAILVGGGVVAGFVASMRSIINVADEVNKTSEKFGIPVESITSLSFAAKLANVEFSDLETGLKKLAANAAAAAGGAKDQAAVFEAMGISVKDAAGNVKTLDGLLREIAGKFAGYEDGLGKAALATEIFSKGGDKLIPFLNHLKESEEEAKKLGAIFGKDLAKAGEDFNDNLTRMNALLIAQRNILAGPLLEALNKYMQQLIEGRAIAGSFLEGIRLFGFSTITSDNALEKINELAKKRDELQTKIDAGPRARGGVDLSSARKDLEDVKKQLAFATVLATQKGEIDNFDSSLNKGFGKKPAPIVPKAPPPGAALTKDTTFEQLLRQYEEMAAKAGEITEFEKLTNLLQTERYRNRTAEQELLAQRALTLAAEADVTKENERVQKEADALRVKFDQDELTRTRQHESEIEKLIEKFTEAADPAAKFRKELEEIAKLRLEKPELTAMLDAAEQAILRSSLAMERFKDDVEEVNEAAQDMTRAIGTAFEDAVLEGKKFGDILQALAKDMARILLRQAVTKPLEQGLTGIFNSFFSRGPSTGSMARSYGNDGNVEGGYLGKFALGTDYVPQTGPYILHKGEAVVPADDNSGEWSGSSGWNGSPTVVQNIRVDSRSDIASVNHAMAVARGQSVAAVQDLNRRTPRRR